MSQNNEPILVTIDVSNIRYDLAGMVREQVKETVDEHLKRLVSKEVEAASLDIVREKIKLAAEETFAAGWKKTDEYGRQTGETRTVRDMILEHLTARDRYSGSGTWLERMLSESLKTTMAAVIQPEIDAAKKAFKEMLDGSIREKLAAALREAMGLK